MPYYRFTGKELDPETGLYYYGARYYDPVLSRWISADPILGKYLPHAGLAAGLSGNQNEEARDPIDATPRYESAIWMIRNYAWTKVNNNATSADADHDYSKQSNNKLTTPSAKIYNPHSLDVFSYSVNNPVNYVDPDGLQSHPWVQVYKSGPNYWYYENKKVTGGVVGVVGSASIGMVGAADGAAGVVVDSEGGSAFLVSGSISRGLQATAGAGASMVLAPFAKIVKSLEGNTFDIQIRFGVQFTLSIPENKDGQSSLMNTALYVDTPGWNIGFGFGPGKTIIVPLNDEK